MHSYESSQIETELDLSTKKFSVKQEIQQVEGSVSSFGDIEKDKEIDISIQPFMSEEPIILSKQEVAEFEVKAQPFIKKEPDLELAGIESSLIEETKLCAETLLFMSECSTLSTCNENSKPTQEGSEENNERGREATNGFDILFQGIELLNSGNNPDNLPEEIFPQPLNPGLSLLCEVTCNDTFEYDLSGDILERNSKLDINLLCTITGTEYYDLVN